VTGAAVALVAILALVVLGIGGGSSGSDPRAAAETFLHRYVDPSGRVIRRDQGGDTVSEGQAYGLLLAQAAGDTATFDRIWQWTRTHLLERDGLLAYLTHPDGSVASTEPASDADLLTAWALSRATGPQAAADHAQARVIAAAILKHETVARSSMLLLAAGPWATGSPASLDPSYWAPQAIAGLERFTGDQQWNRLATWTNAALLQLSDDGRRLPPDWARLDGTTVSGTPAPDHSAPQVQYGLDAQRTVVWLAASCTRSDIRLAARWWGILSRSGRARALVLTPEGQLRSSQTNALPLVAAAAAAGAAGEGAARQALLAQARKVQAEHPTYYGGAWLALGENLLDPSSPLGRCQKATGGAPA
jgi:endoglucanase